MALINCPECSNKVSNTSVKCPSCGIKLRKLRRSFFGKIVKWAFIGFNILMIAWLFDYFMRIGELSSSINNDAEEAGAAIGATIGISMLLGIWGFGDIILGLFVVFTRPKQ